MTHKTDNGVDAAQSKTPKHAAREKPARQPLRRKSGKPAAPDQAATMEMAETAAPDRPARKRGMGKMTAPRRKRAAPVPAAHPLPVPANDPDGPLPLAAVAPGRGVLLGPAPEPHVMPDAARPIPRNRAPVLYRKGLVANFGDWLRSAAEGVAWLMPRKRKPQRVVQPAMPAIARANREISSLRIENARLRRKLDALEAIEQGRQAVETARKEPAEG
ncbi:hypothetical protein [Novosphingobium album (ex Liu et al. 2023)]|uniref:Uncharacterized protein n=1 Tax=Novosphingobium album (ex Liu et al. 2023) TaxID=3031130 RepID=A0ABT5WWZ7_9SPHN|nr:hypothetical protein [Novosphingobium album (ex Liu et al. 2023)]MDE8654418.1 hypothetical protein [Novosphingobium album (ex Liu et al. 2023)]